MLTYYTRKESGMQIADGRARPPGRAAFSYSSIDRKPLTIDETRSWHAPADLLTQSFPYNALAYGSARRRIRVAKLK